MDMDETVPNLNRDKTLTLGSDIEKETGVPVIRVTDDDFFDSHNDEAEKEKDKILENKIRPIIREIRNYLNTSAGIRKTNPAGKYFSIAKINMIKTEIEKLNDYHKKNPESSVCYGLIKQLTNLKNELENKINSVYGSLEGGFKKRSKRKHTNKRKKKLKRRTIRKR